MDWIRISISRLESLFGRRRRDRALEEEFRSHIDLATEDHIARGMTGYEARRAALRSFGGVTQTKEAYRRQRGIPMLETLVRDTTYALRQLRRNPSFTAIAVLTLALGIGVNIAIFSIVNGILLSSLHIRQENRVLELGLQEKDASWSSRFSVPEYRDLRSQSKSSFSSVALEEYSLDGLSAQSSQPSRVLTDFVTGNYFQTLGVQPLLGRFFLDSEGETSGADPIVVLSYTYWKHNFNGDPGVVGRQVALNGIPVTVIGVTPQSFHGVSPLFGLQVFIPLGMQPAIETMPQDEWIKRSHRAMRLFGRLQPGIAPSQADTTLAVLARRFAAEHPDDEKNMTMRTFPLYEGRTGDLDTDNTVGVVTAFFIGLASLVLLLACVNVSNLLLVRANVREREMVIRSALGAERSRLIRQMLTESLLLALAGGAAGIGLGLMGSYLLSSVNLQTDIPFNLDFGLDWHVLAFSVAVALFAGAVVGIVPALRFSRANLNLILREGGRGVVRGGNKFRDALVTIQVGSALMLLIVAGLFVRSLRQAEHIDFGFNPSNVLPLTTDPGEIGYNDAQSREFQTTLLQRVRALPGVQSATNASSIPMGLINSGGDTVNVSGYQPPPGQPAPSYGYNTVSTNYFQTLQIPISEGRNFTESDNENGAYVAIVSQSMVKKFWPNQDPIGKQISLGLDPAHPMQVVGVVKDVRYQGFSGAIDPYFYMPYLQHYKGNSLRALEIRTTGDPAAMIPEVEGIIRQIAPSLPVFEVKTLHQALYSPNGLLIFQVAAAMAGIMGTLGLVLAIVGVYGVLSYVVSQRTHEIGIRMALGAQRGDVLRIVYRQGLWIVGIGLAVGVAGSLSVAHLLGSMIVVSSTDPITYLAVSATLAAIALLACYIPARRAMRVEPMQALRTE